MKISNRLKKLIFKKLFEDLSNVEIIPHGDSIWFIDRENEYWHFEYEKNGRLWWRYDYFQSFFRLFSLESKVYQSILAEWVEEVLNYKVSTTLVMPHSNWEKVEEVLNYKVSTTELLVVLPIHVVEEVLNCKVGTTFSTNLDWERSVEEVLNCKVDTTSRRVDAASCKVEEVLGPSYYH